ncbi:hypothetical protein ACNAW0_15070 [Micromonospora sp. SL1-18]|uniref:hypothetical protein n=1 Tax=Micromonospora sp. SL1-18 TaxID=3399128 RepID=UPI003A4DA52E
MSNTLPVCRARWRDIPDIVDLVVDPFAGSTVGAWLVPDERRRRDVLSAVIRVWTEHALLFGEAYLLQDHSAAAVWLHRYGPIPPPTAYGERLAVACGDHLDRFLRLDEVLSAHRPAGPHNHLAFFAVAPSPRRLSRATTLLANSNARMGQALLPTYTEATTIAERDLYARHGYVPHEPFHLPDGTTAYPMWRSAERRRPNPSPAIRARPDRPGRSCPVNDLPIRVILDTSAIVAFTRGSTVVGEVIAAVAEEGCLFGLPVMCLAEASASAVDSNRLDLLVNHPAAAVLTVDPLRWRDLAAAYRTVGRLGTASALLAADDECIVLTDQAERGRCG